MRDGFGGRLFVLQISRQTVKLVSRVQSQAVIRGHKDT